MVTGSHTALTESERAHGDVTAQRPKTTQTNKGTNKASASSSKVGSHLSKTIPEDEYLSLEAIEEAFTYHSRQSMMFQKTDIMLTTFVVTSHF